MRFLALAGDFLLNSRPSSKANSRSLVVQPVPGRWFFLLALTLTRACSTTTCDLHVSSQIRSRQLNTCHFGIRANSLP